MGKKGFNINWNIENFYFWLQENWNKPEKSETGKFVLASPSFLLDTIKSTRWRLSLESTGERMSCYLKLSLTREREDDGPENVILDLEFSILVSTGHGRFIQNYNKVVFLKEDTCSSVKISLIDFYLLRDVDLLPRDSVSFRCKIWETPKNKSVLEKRTLRTRILLKHVVTDWILKDFTTLCCNEDREMKIKSISSKNQSKGISMRIRFVDKGTFEVRVSNDGLKNICRCMLFLLDSAGNRSQCEESEIILKPGVMDMLTLPANFTRQKLIENKALYLQNDVLTFQSEIAYTSGELEGYEIENQARSLKSSGQKDNQNPTCLKEHYLYSSVTEKPYLDSSDSEEHHLDSSDKEEYSQDTTDLEERYLDSSDIDEHSRDTADAEEPYMDSSDIDEHSRDTADVEEYYLNSPDTAEHSQNTTDAAKVSSACLWDNTDQLSNNEEENSQTFQYFLTSTMKKDLLSLYNDMLFTDTKLLSGTDTFPAHKSILCMRSPVFKAMFTKESVIDCVQIPDFHSETVRQMLLFMYTDTTENLDWDKAKELYRASNKYQILSLRQKCSSFLFVKLSPSNACEILLLSHKHRDITFKKAIQNFIVKHSKDIFPSPEWKKFLKSNALLAAETMCLNFE